MTVVVDIHEARTQLSRLIEQVAAGERVVISVAGHPVADLIQHGRPGVFIGGLKGRVRYSDDDWDNADLAIAEMFYGAPT